MIEVIEWIEEIGMIERIERIGLGGLFLTQRHRDAETKGRKPLRGIPHLSVPLCEEIKPHARQTSTTLSALKKS